jgi:RNase H-like domain found in reverse transcriptase/Reverse transcriptase (RNA-dependent DNA polymerase)
MGVLQSPDIAQEIMEDIFRNLSEVDVYIDDIGVFSNVWQAHCASLVKVLDLLESNNFTVNPFKCEQRVQETDWLGYWLTPTGLKPWTKKIAAILALQRPQTAKPLRSFIGAITYYCDMLPKRSHTLAPLTALVGGKGNLPWTPECQQAFDATKAMLAKECFLRYPDHNKRFDIYCDASDLQFGAVIMQEDHPVAYYSRKLNSAQRNYTVGEKKNFFPSLKLSKCIEICCMDVKTFMSIQTIRTTHFSTVSNTTCSLLETILGGL